MDENYQNTSEPSADNHNTVDTSVNTIANDVPITGNEEQVNFQTVPPVIPAESAKEAVQPSPEPSIAVQQASQAEPNPQQVYQQNFQQTQQPGNRPQSDYQQPNNYEYHNAQQYREVPPKTQGGDTRPMSMGDWLVTMLLMIIPCVNIVLLFVWAFGDKNGNINRRNWSRANLIIMGIVLAIYLIVIVIAVIAGISAFSHGYGY